MLWTERLVELKLQGLTYTGISDSLNAEFPLDGHFTEGRVRGWWRRHKNVAVKAPVGHVQAPGGDCQGNLPIDDAEGLETADRPVSSIEYLPDGSVRFKKIIELFDDEPATPEKLLETHGLDAEKWTMLTCTNNFWQAQAKGGRKLVLYQSKITVKPNIEGLSLDAIDKHFAEMSRSYVAPVPYVAKSDLKNHVMAEANIADCHYAKLAWHGDCGEDYDHRIARQVFEQSVERICDELSGKPVEYVLFVWTNDYFNSDTITNTTTAGTPQSCDSRWQKMFNGGVDALVNGIDRLKMIAPIRTFYVPSNHDQQSSYYATKYLEAWYRNDANVSVDSDAYPRKYHLYGKQLLGFCHGDKEGKESTSREKASRLASLMPIEAPSLWSQARFREMHAAHLHSEQMIQEINGVIVRRISSPTASDTWHTESGYVGAVRKVQTFVYDKEFGNVMVLNTPVGY